MKRLLVLLTVLILLSGCVKEEKNMAVEFDATVLQGVTWATGLTGSPALAGITLDEFSIVAIARLDAFPQTLTYVGGIYSTVSGDEGAAILVKNDGRLYFAKSPVGGLRDWQSDAADLVAGNTYTLGASLDGSDIANRPLLYIDGALVTTNVVTETGTQPTEHDDTMPFLGAPDQDARHAIDGVAYLLAFFDRILIAEEHMSIHETRSVDGMGAIWVVGVSEGGGVVDILGGEIGTINAGAVVIPDDYLHVR